MSQYIKRTPTCWLWRGRRHKSSPYPKIRNSELLHRVAWELTRGPIPRGMCVLHRCDNVACVRPSHLFLGTHADNVRDMVSKGRNVRGRYQWAAKLTEAKVRKIRKLLSGGFTQARIAKQFGVSEAAISLIKKGVNWGHVK